MVAMVQVPAAVPSTADIDVVAPRSYLAEGSCTSSLRLIPTV
jgi:hypothetical protein